MLTGTRAGATTTPRVAPARTFFQGAEAVAMAAEAVGDMLAVAPVTHADLRGTYGLRLAERYTLSLAPGVVAMRRSTSVFERDDSPAFDRGGPVLFGLEDFESPEGALVVDDVAPVRSVISEWSRASRARFHRRMAELDYTPWQDKRLAMVTLTLPSHWQRVAPTGADFKRLVKALRKRWEKATGLPLFAVWKLEFQGRGAPHLHMLCEVPGEIEGEYGPTWVGRNWVEVCDPQGKDRARMLRAHLPSHKRPAGIVDYSARMTDPKRIAVYFGKHAAKTRDGKEYQHIVPEEWQEKDAGPGRFWGYWRLQRAVTEVEVERDVWFRMRRILRHVDRARQADQALKERRAARIKGEELRRESLLRLKVRKTRRYTGLNGGWTLTPDALMTAYDMARAVAPPLSEF